MALSNSTIEEFIQITRDEYGEDLSKEQAGQILKNLVGYFSLLAKLQNYNNENESPNGKNEGEHSR